MTDDSRLSFPALHRAICRLIGERMTQPPTMNSTASSSR
jgi:hypothetical protein